MQPSATVGATSHSPIRGSLKLSVNPSSPQVIAGSDFSIFVTILNPFEIPITIYQVQTHIPVELIDVNGRRIRLAEMEKGRDPLRNTMQRVRDWLESRLQLYREHAGIAIAVGTEFDPNLEMGFSTTVQVEKISGNAKVVGVQFAFPEHATAEELDRIFRRVDQFRKGLIPVTLQPGDSVVRQFVLRTRQWLLFTPLTHRFQIQVNFSGDGTDHSDTITHELTIRSTVAAVTVGAICGALLGTTLKILTEASPITKMSVLRVLASSILASLGVVLAFARKNAAQSIISVEDFWGGALIGFSTGFFGFEKFRNLFPKGA